jgi:hypothetical protein
MSTIPLVPANVINVANKKNVETHSVVFCVIRRIWIQTNTTNSTTVNNNMGELGHLLAELSPIEKNCFSR